MGVKRNRMDTHFSGRSYKVILAIALFMVASACANELQTASKAALLDQQIYKSISTQSVNLTHQLVQKARQGPITERDKNTLATLNDLNHKLDTYAQMHNFYVDILLTWQATGQKPPAADQYTKDIAACIEDIMNVASSVGIYKN